MKEGIQAARIEEPRPLHSTDRDASCTSLVGTLRLLRRQWALLAAICAATTGLAILVSLARGPSYRSEATIEVGPDRPLIADGPAVDISARDSHLWESHFHTQETLLRRPGLLAGVLESLTPDKVAEYLRSPEPVRALSNDLEITAVPSTFLIRISLDHRRPDHGPEIVNKLAALFLEDSGRRLRDLKSGLSAELLTGSLPVIRRKLSDAERALQAFDAEAGFGVSQDRLDALLESAKKIGERRLEVRLRSIGLRSSPAPRAEELPESALSPMAEPEAMGIRPASLEALEAERTALELELARQRALLKDKHPTILSLQNRLDALAKLTRTAVRAAADQRDRAVDRAAQKREREVAAATLEERSLDEEESQLDTRIAKARELVGQRVKLEGEVVAGRELLTTYLKRQGELEAMAGTELPSVRVVDPARAPRPVQPARSLYLALGLVVGLALGAIAIVVADQMDDRLMDPQQAEAALGLDALASIPRMPPAPGSPNLPRLAVDDPSSEELEPFRRLRSEIEARQEGRDEARILAVVSASYGEGKSTVAVNLARALALEGRRVLLVDADLRRPGLMAFVTRRKSPGLDAHLRSGLGISMCVQASRIPGVSLLASSGPIDRPAETARSGRIRALWPALKSGFDFIVVDTSPIAAASEAAAIAAGADGSILVVEEKRTRARDVVRARRRLDTHRVRVMGLVVNRSRQGLSPRFDSTRSFLNFDRISEEKNLFLEVG